MNKKKELLIEIGCEEIPVNDQIMLQEQMKVDFIFYMSEARINHDEPQIYTTPRRILLYCSYVEEKQEAISNVILGPPFKVAFDEDGNPTQAAIKFAHQHNTDVNKLITVENKKGRYLAYQEYYEGEETVKLLPVVLEKMFSQITFKRGMYWESSRFIFTRPIRWLIVLYKGEVVPVTIADVSSSNITRGHRFLGESYIVVNSWDEYVNSLQKNYVQINNQSRKLSILNQMQEIVKKINARIREDEEILRYAIHSVEYPYVILCNFPIQFLFLPEELIITCLKEHQKAFVIEDNNGKLLPYFIVIANVDKDEFDLIKEGNEKVANARLKDAVFFWEEDKKTGLQKLKLLMPKIVFQGGRGTLADKINRLVNLIKFISTEVGLDATQKLLAVEAGELCKCDLASKVINEFPTLQGRLGGLLAKEEKMSKDIVQAIYEHYQPITINEEVPASRIAAVISLSDKFDNLCIAFAYRLEISGSKDPYGIRRQALAFCKLLIEYPFFISLKKLINTYEELMRITDKNSSWKEELFEFVLVKFKSIAEQKNIRYDMVNSIMAVQNDDLHDAWLRLLAINEIMKEQNFDPLISAYKRINNILKGQAAYHIIDTSLFKQEEEDALYQAWLVLQEEWKVYLRLKSYKNAFNSLLPMITVINNFFDNVLVIDEDKQIRNNRIALLNNINNTFMQLVDLSEIVIPGRI